MAKKIMNSLLLKDLRSVAELLGESPSAARYDENGRFTSWTISRRFGFWAEALKKADLPPLKKRTPLRRSDEILLADVRRVAALLGRRPSVRDYRREGAFAFVTLQKRFGGWSVILRRAALADPADPHLPALTRQDVENDLRRLETELKRPPTGAEYESLGRLTVPVVLETLGARDWTEVLANFYGLTPLRIKKLIDGRGRYKTDDELLGQLRELAGRLGYTPLHQEAKAYLKMDLYYRRFGVWRRVVAAAGLTQPGKMKRGKKTVRQEAES